MWKLRLEVEDRPAVLDGDDAAGGEAAAVADPVDLVEDRHRRVARAQEVGVERVHVAVGSSTVRAAATSAWPATWPPNTRWRSSSGERAAEDVDLDRLQVEQRHEVVDGGHSSCTVDRMPHAGQLS